LKFFLQEKWRIIQTRSSKGGEYQINEKKKSYCVRFLI
jgi:hypothetical protein